MQSGESDMGGLRDRPQRSTTLRRGLTWRQNARAELRWHLPVSQRYDYTGGISRNVPTLLVRRNSYDHAGERVHGNLRRRHVRVEEVISIKRRKQHM
jgi:hypothetical protein